LISHFISNQKLWLGLAVSVLALYFWALFSLSLNIPIGDDFPAFVDIAPDAVSGKLTARTFFKQINEHRILYNRIFWISGIGLFKAIDFKLLIIIGNLSLIGITWMFIRFQRQLAVPAGMIFVFANLFFSWVGYSNSLCSMMALQNFTFPLLAIAGLWLMTEVEKPNKVFLGLSLLTLAFYTTGLGFVAMLLGLFYLGFRKKYKLLIWASIPSAIFIFLYFLFFEPSPVQSSIFSGLSQPIELLKRYFAFIGGALPISFLSPIPEVILGVLLTGMLLWSIYSLKWDLPHNLFIITIFFMLLAAVVVAARFELNEYIANRFKINSAVLFASIAILFLKSIHSLKIRAFVTASFIVFTGILLAFSYKSYRDYKFWVDEFAVDLLNVKYGVETTAYLPKKAEHISRSFYNDDFQKLYFGLSESTILQPGEPIQILPAENSWCKIRGVTLYQLHLYNRPAIKITSLFGKTIGYLPIHQQLLSCKDSYGIARDQNQVKCFLVDLLPKK
jgi:hypothetical protein